jgi:hypothetical protein
VQVGFGRLVGRLASPSFDDDADGVYEGGGSGRQLGVGRGESRDATNTHLDASDPGI